MECGMPENREPYQETEEFSLNMAESAGFVSVRREADMEMRCPPGGEQEKTETVKQPSGQPDTPAQIQRLANAEEKHGKIPQPADGKGMSGYMQARTSVREKLAAIRARRAAEPSQDQAQELQIKKDRAPGL